MKPVVFRIEPIMFGDAALSQQMAARLVEKGIYAIGFFYPVVPKGTARIRVQIPTAHSMEDLNFTIRLFKEVKKEFGL